MPGGRAGVARRTKTRAGPRSPHRPAAAAADRHLRTLGRGQGRADDAPARRWRLPPPRHDDRAPASPGEVDGVHYHFATHDQFEAATAAGELLEHALVHGTYYGTPRSSLRDALASGLDVLLQVDVQGARSLRKALDGALFVFIAPESLNQLERRLRDRAGAGGEEIMRRLDSARAELQQQHAFDVVVVNIGGDLDGTVERVRALIARERGRPGRRVVEV